MIRQSLTESLTLARPLCGFFKTHAAKRFHRSRHRHAFAIKIGHDDKKALIFLANKILYRHTHVIKVKRGGIRCPPPLLFIQLRATETFRIGRYQQHRDTP